MTFENFSGDLRTVYAVTRCLEQRATCAATITKTYLRSTYGEPCKRNCPRSAPL